MFIEKGDAFKGEGLLLRFKVTGKVKFRLGSGMRRTIGFWVALFGFFTFSFAQPGWGPDVRLSYGSGDGPKVACSDRYVHVVWYEVYSGAIMYARSTDRGNSWATAETLAPPTGYMPAVAASDNFVHVAWFKPNGDRIIYRRSTNYGTTWGRFDTLTFTGYAVPHLGVAGDTVFLLARNVFSNPQSTVMMKSSNRGFTWGPIQLVANKMGNEGLAVHAPLIFVALDYADTINVRVDIHFTKSTDGGRTWSPTIIVSDLDPYASQWPSICADTSCDPNISWFDGKYSPYPWTGDIFYRTSRDTGITWEPIDTLTVEHRAKYPSVVAQGDSLHVTWSDDRVQPDINLEIFYRMSPDLGNTWGSVYRLTYAERHSLFPSLAAGDTFLHLVWSDDRPDTLTGGRQIYYKRKALFPSGVEVLFPRGQKNESSMLRVYPNPSKGEFRIYSSFPGELSVYDISGRRVRILTPSDSRITPNFYLWDGRDEKGTEVRSGEYFIQLRTGKGGKVIKKVTVLRGRR